jgi:hypothetical protein
MGLLMGKRQKRKRKPQQWHTGRSANVLPVAGRRKATKASSAEVIAIAIEIFGARYTTYGKD